MVHVTEGMGTVSSRKTKVGTRKTSCGRSLKTVTGAPFRFPVVLFLDLVGGAQLGFEVRRLMV